MGAALKYKQPQQSLKRQEGELGRLKVVRGPDMGSIFVLTSPRASVGRGDENDVILNDLRTSRKHCELVLDNGVWSVVDAGSVNGIALNGKPSRGGAVKTKDTISLGETTLEFFAPEAGTLVLVAPPGSAEQIRHEQNSLDIQRARIQAMSRIGGLAKNLPHPDHRSATAKKAPLPSSSLASKSDSKRLMMIGAVALLGAYLFLSDGSPPPEKPKLGKKSDSPEKNEVPGFDNLLDSEAVEKTADMFFRNGFREYRLGNYLRAKTQFENVLQMSPNHRLAKIYLKNAENSIQAEVKEHLDIGRKSLDSGKLNDAKGHFESVIRLLFRDPQNPAFIEAHDQLERVHKEQLGGDL